MQAAGRRVDPSDDDFTPAVGEAANTAGEVASKGDLALRERQLGQRDSLIVRGPATKSRARAAC